MPERKADAQVKSAVQTPPQLSGRDEGAHMPGLIKVADKEYQVLPKREPDHQRVIHEDGKIQLILQEFINDMR